MNWLICYDISDDKARTSVHRLLRRYSASYQKSGLEIPFLNKKELFELLQCVGEKITEEDRLLVVKLAENQASWRLGISNSAPLKHLMLWC